MARTSFYALLAERLAEQYSVSSFVIQADNAHIPSRAIQQTAKWCRWSNGHSRQATEPSCDTSSRNNSDSQGQRKSPSLPRRSVTPPSDHLYEVMRGGSKPTRPERKSSPRKNGQSQSPTNRGHQSLVPRVPRRYSNNKNLQNIQALANKYADLIKDIDEENTNTSETEKVKQKENRKDLSKSWPNLQLSLRNAPGKSLSSSNLFNKNKQFSPASSRREDKPKKRDRVWPRHPPSSPA